MRRLVASFCLLVLPLLAGCTYSWVDSSNDLPTTVEVGKTTRREVISEYGNPSLVRQRPAGRVLVYRYTYAEGRGAGLGTMLTPLLFPAHVSTGRDTVEVLLDDEDVVTDLRVIDHTDHLDVRWWPFYDETGD